MNNPLTVKATINAPIEKVFEMFTNPTHIMVWNTAHESWHCPAAQNNVIEGGKFVYTMAARDGSMQFDFSGTFDKVIINEKLEIILDDNRMWHTSFETDNNSTVVTETFEPESVNPIELQQAGWQSILDNFKNYVETN
jgi:uncharacterized protein YndB with AHSA1/START domain